MPGHVIFDSVSNAVNRLYWYGGHAVATAPPIPGQQHQGSDWVLTAPGDILVDLGPVLREALAWVIRLHSGAATSDDAEVLAQWRAKSPEHDAAFRDAVRLWRTFGDATRTPELDLVSPDGDE